MNPSIGKTSSINGELDDDVDVIGDYEERLNELKLEKSSDDYIQYSKFIKFHLQSILIVA